MDGARDRNGPVPTGTVLAEEAIDVFATERAFDQAFRELFACAVGAPVYAGGDRRVGGGGLVAKRCYKTRRLVVFYRRRLAWLGKGFDRALRAPPCVCTES